MEKTIQFYSSSSSKGENLKCWLVAELCGVTLQNSTDKVVVPYFPAVSDGATLIFGANSVSKYLAMKSNSNIDYNSLLASDLLNIEEDRLLSVINKFSSKSDDADSIAELTSILTTLESNQFVFENVFVGYVLYSAVSAGLALTDGAKFSKLSGLVAAIAASAHFVSASQKMSAKVKPTIANPVVNADGSAAGKKEKTKKDKTASAASAAGPAVTFSCEDVVVPVLGDIDWGSTGLISSLKIIFTAAIVAAFPQSAALQLDAAVISRCGNPNFGDFQCNNAMGLSKALKGVEGYSGPVSPKDIAERIAYAIPKNPIVSTTSIVPNGFINIKLSSTTITDNIAQLTQVGAKPPHLQAKKVLVDFSSPNIAKEMHVGHLRSTIIGDSICRILEFCGFEVMRVNHVGDWGTQFGMLITYLQEKFPDILENPPNISDLTVIYKESKKRFDADEQFKETSRLNVVKLQSGDFACRAIWTLLCNISRKEFQVVYDTLDVKLDEVGESFYNPMIPSTIEELQALGLVEDENGMLIIKLPHFTIPLMVRKSDGGYGYDSTDMAALKYRIQELNRDWLIYITDAGQAPHFHMCFDAGKAANWVGDRRIDHIGFGVVCGDDGKRFKTRSSETVRLIDLLNAAKDKMRDSLQTRADEGKSPLSGQDLEDAAKIIGYGAVKYFDLKQHPSTNYIFSYDRMLDTKGDTAVYLLFAYARLVSILRKAKEEKKIDLEAVFPRAASLLVVEHPAERALAFELLQLGDVVKSVIQDLLPNRLCDYLKELAVKFTDFVTKCHVLNADSENATLSRLLLCEATKQVMAKCFHLLGINTLERI